MEFKEDRVLTLHPRLRAYIFIYMCVYVYEYKCIQVQTHECVYIYICEYKETTYTHTNIFTYRKPPLFAILDSCLLDLAT